VIEPRNLYNRGQVEKITKDKRRNIGGKANAVIEVEGSRPECAKASTEVTTGVEEQGMSSKG
jgi:hypothetical protein